MENTEEKLLENSLEKPPDGRGRSPGSRRTQIRKGENRPAGIKQRQQEPVTQPEPVFEDGVELSPLLVDFRKVANGQVTARTPRKTPTQAAILRMFAEDFERFLTRYERLEKDFRVQRDAIKKPAEEMLSPEESEERIQRTIREILDKAKGKTAIPSFRC